jgi:hypothetical protein
MVGVAHAYPRAGHGVLAHRAEALDPLDAAIGLPHDLCRMLARKFLGLALPGFASHPGDAHHHWPWRSARVLDADERVDRVSVRLEPVRLPNPEALFLPRECQVCRRALGAQHDGRVWQIHRDHGPARAGVDDQAHRPKASHDHHGLVAAIEEVELLELAPLAADHRQKSGTLDSRQPLSGPAGRRRLWFLLDPGGQGNRRGECRLGRRGLFGRSLVRDLPLAEEKRLVDDEERRHEDRGEYGALLHRQRNSGRAGGGS